MPDISSVLASTVIFLYAQGGEIPIGTGFIVGVPAPGIEGALVPVIVTARHVLGDHKKVVARFSSKAGAAPGFVEYDLEKLRNDNDLWLHPDDGVDIIAFRTPHFEEAEYQLLPLDLVASKEDFKQEEIVQADRVVFPSLLVNFMGLSRNYPVLKGGTIALMPDEDVPLRYEIGKMTISTKQRILLLDAISIPGASGSPVFLWPGPRLKGNSYQLGGTKPFLLGVMHGFYPAWNKLNIVETTEVNRFFGENSGIAIGFPSWRLREILESDKALKRIGELAQSKK